MAAKPGTYAADTKVSPEKSRLEIEQTLRRYGADAFGSGQDGVHAVVTFRLEGVTVRIDVPIPTVADMPTSHPNRYGSYTLAQREVKRDQAERQRWRAILLMVKAKCESVELGIESVQQAWMPYILLPNNTTVGEFLEPQIARAYETGEMPSLLPGVRGQLGEGS